MVAGVRRNGWTQSTPGRRAARHRGQQVRGSDSPPEPRGRSGGRAEVALPRAPVSISRRDSANLRPTRARGGGPPRSSSRPPGPSAPAPRTPGRRRRSTTRTAPRPTSLRGPAGARPRVESTPARGLCAALTQLVLGGGGGGRSHVAPGSERVREGGRGGREARGARGRRRAVSRRTVPQGPGAASAPLRGAALRPPGRPAACVLRAASVAPAAPRLTSSRRGPLPLRLAPRKSRCRPCGRGTVPARRLCSSAPGSPASRRLLYLERAEPSFPPPAPRAPALARSLARAELVLPTCRRQAFPPRGAEPLRAASPLASFPHLRCGRAASDLSPNRSP